MTIPYAWVSYADYEPGFCRWDQQWIDRVVRGEEGVGHGLTFEQSSRERVLAEGGILLIPVGSYHEHGERHVALRKLWDDMLAMPWGVVIATSDECSTFEWHKIDPWPAHVRLWVQLPRPERTYPPGTMFYGEGSPSVAQLPWGRERDIDVFLSAQGGHVRRDECFAALVDQHRERWVVQRTLGFTEGMSGANYVDHMRRAWVAPAPAGICSQSSFRAFEALEAGAVPIVDARRPDGGTGYWEMIGLGFLRQCDDWSMVGDHIEEILADPHWEAARTSSLWQIYKRDVVARLHEDVLAARQGATGHADLYRPSITAVVPTSPIPSHPDASMLFETVESIRDRLPDAEVLITCDGVRPEQADRRDAYVEYLHRVTEWCLPQQHVVPFVFDQHLHQSGMMHRILPEISTPFLLYVEHDCPLVGEIPFDAITREMNSQALNSVRFMHEAGVLPDHAHLFLDRHTDGWAPWQATIQWSQRPHLARTSWYADIMGKFFGSAARTMIEDVMHGVVQHGFAINSPYATRKHAEKAWRRYRMAVYAPDGDMRRSGHLDGRGDDPKFPMIIAYDGERPEGAPPEGEWT